MELSVSVKICLFCGSRDGTAAKYLADAEALGVGIVARKWSLVYGGGGAGLMGAVAKSVLARGGEVIGLIPQSLMELEKAHPRLSELIVTQSMHERKQGMVDRSDAFVVLPGGFGTLDELCEVTTWAQLGIHNKPIVLINSEGFWAGFIQFINSAVQAGFIPVANLDLIKVVDTVEEALAYIEKSLKTK